MSKFVEKTKEEFEALSAAEQKKYLAEKAEAEKATAKTKEVFEEKAEEAKKSGEDQPIDLTSKIKVEFLNDVGYMKKGTKTEISQTAFDAYNFEKQNVKVIR